MKRWWLWLLLAAVAWVAYRVWFVTRLNPRLPVRSAIAMAASPSGFFLSFERLNATAAKVVEVADSLGALPR